jgi:hypothetical protein
MKNSIDRWEGDLTPFSADKREVPIGASATSRLRATNDRIEAHNGRSLQPTTTADHAPKETPRAPPDSVSPHKSKHDHEPGVGRCQWPWLSSSRSSFAAIRSAVPKPSVNRS